MSDKPAWSKYAKTIPQLFFERSGKWSDHVVMRKKESGRWKDITWKDLEKDMLEVAAGLIHLGLEGRGPIAILSGNRPAWLAIDLGSQTANIINVPIYPTNTAEQVAYILNDSAAQIVFVENRLQLEKILAVRDQVPSLRKAVVIDPHPEQGDFVMDLDALRKVGRATFDREAIDARTKAIDPEQVATLIYTSGTTGNPKGVMLCHRNIVSNIASVPDFIQLHEGDSDLQFLPMCHSFGRLEVYVFLMHHGTINLAEAIDKIPDNLKEIKPLIFVTVPRLLEKVHEKIVTGLEEASTAKRTLFNWAQGVGKQVLKDKMAKRRSSVLTTIQFEIAERLVFSKIKQALGGNLRILVYAAAPLALDIQEFFASMGIIALEAYGLTETSPGLTGNKTHEFRLGSVGKPIRDTEIRIAEDGEILARGPQIMLGYWNRPEDTEEALEGGWFHTGDIGRIDEDGFLYITDRKKDLIITAGGKNVAPQNIENLLKMDVAIEQVAIVGDRRKYLVALVVPNFEWLSKFAADKGLGDDREALLEHPEVKAEYERRIIASNKKLAKYETIKKFELLTEEFSVENGMLTPTMKVRRKNVMQVYDGLIDGMY